jgi:hypothetical protein
MSGKQEFEFELKLANGKVVRWHGRDGDNACKRYADVTGNTVVAWRYVRHGLYVGAPGPGRD